MSQQVYTVEFIDSNDDKVVKADYTEVVFKILKDVYSFRELEYILEALKCNKGGKLESCNLY